MRRSTGISTGAIVGFVAGLFATRRELAAGLSVIEGQDYVSQGMYRLASLQIMDPLREWLLFLIGGILLFGFLPLRVKKPAALLVAATLVSLPLLIANLATTMWAHAAPPRPLNVVWILLDTLRADHLGCYGYPKNTSPFIDSIASKGFLFEHATSQESYTLASAASYFTSKSPPETGVLYDKPDGIDTVAPSHLTIAEVFKNAGYATAGFVFNPHMKARFQFAQGFDVYDDSTPYTTNADKKGLPQHEVYETCNKMLVKLQSFFTSRVVKSPAFIYMHYRDVHGPYLPPPPYHSTFLPERFKPQEDLLAKIGHQFPFSRANRDLYVSQYDGEILYNDQGIRNAFMALAMYGIDLDNTIVVITSDHGEEFRELHPGDQSGVNHGRTLYMEQIHVPLIIYDPRLKADARRIGDRIELTDIAPTLADLLEFEADGSRSFRGRSLGPLMRGEQLEPRPAFGGGNRGRGYLIDGNWAIYRYAKEIKNEQDFFHNRPAPGFQSEYGTELYNLAVDPDQRTNLYREPEHASMLERLEMRLMKHLERESGGSTQAQLTPQETHDLGALGYGEGGDPGADPDADGLSPSDTSD